MPELPEVETVRRGLEQTIVGKTIASVDVRAPQLFADDRSRIDSILVGQRIDAVQRRAKVLLIRLSSNWTLAIHLKMTGQIIVIGKGAKHSFVGGHPEKAYEQELPHKHTHIIITFTDGATLYFNDLRKFGWFRLYPGASVRNLLAIEDIFKRSRLGPEPFSDAFSLSYLAGVIAKRAIPIKTVLLDQTVVAGIGNIYADEALFSANIRPTRKAKSLSKIEVKALHAAIKHVLQLGIDYGGTTMNTFRTVEGTTGQMREHLKVYSREGLSCTACGNPIKRIKIGQRSSHFCPRCQQ